MARPTPPDAYGDESPGADPAARLDRWKALLETATPAEARAAVPELISLSAPRDRGEPLRLAVGFSGISDYSDDELLRLWSAVEGDPEGFCETLRAPAYCARRAVRKLMSLSEPGDGGAALKLAARFTGKDAYACRWLLRQWKTARDPDGFAQHLLAPAFREEGRTELRLLNPKTLRGLRHLTMLTALYINGSRGIADVTELGALTGLTHLELKHCRGLADLTPIGRLTRLTRLDLTGCGSVEDTEPLLHLSRLRELSLTWTAVRSVRGFDQALPDLESLDLRFCPSFTDVDALAGLRSLTHLRVSHLDRLRDLSPFAALAGLTSLHIEECEGLTTLEGLGPDTRLTKLALHDCHNLRSLEGLGEQPALQEVQLVRDRSLTGLRGLGRMPALRTLMINGAPVSDLDDLAGSPLRTLTLYFMEALDSLGALQHCPGLEELTLRDCPGVQEIPELPALKELALQDCPGVPEIPAGSLDSLRLSGRGRMEVPRLAGGRDLRTLDLGPHELVDVTAAARLPNLAELDLRGCRSVPDLGPLLDMPSLTRIRLPDKDWAFTDSGTLHPVMSELKARGVGLTIGD